MVSWLQDELGNHFQGTSKSPIYLKYELDQNT